MDFKAISDGALIGAIQQKDLGALEEFYDRHHRVALAVAYRVLSDRELSEDVVQEAFLAVWRQAQGYQSERGGVRTWFLSIVRHRAIDLTRSKSYSRESQSLDEEVTGHAEFDVGNEVSIKLEREQVRSAVNLLPAEQRDAILMAYFGGYTYKEVAQRVGVPLGTIKGRIRLGMQKLRDTLFENLGGG